MTNQEMEIVNLREALGLALVYLERFEPGDSRAVSDEFVALAAVQCGLGDDACMAVIRRALRDSGHGRDKADGSVSVIVSTN